MATETMTQPNGTKSWSLVKPENGPKAALGLDRVRPRTTRAPPALLAAILLATASAAAPAAEPPFDHLIGQTGTVVSNDGYSVWLYWHADRASIEYPGRPGFRHDAGQDTGYQRILLEAVCRADPRRPGLSGPSPVRANLSLPMHPDDADVPAVLDPRHWWREFAGSAETRTPATITFGDGTAHRTEIFERHVDWSFPRPDVRVAVRADAAIEALLSQAPTTVTVRSRTTRSTLVFSPSPDVARTARAMRRHCPPERAR